MGKKRIVVKIGSSSLTNDKGEVDQGKLAEHIQALAALRQANHEVILVSSGAVAAGFTGLGYSSRPVTIKGKQAAAAVGQGLLIQSYIEKLKAFNLISAQLLLTRNDFSNRERYRNAFSTITELLERGILPIINENDTVSIEELTFGDNDMLSALVSGFVHADQLIILTDINGLYDGNPRKDPLAEKIHFLENITDDMVNGTDDTGSKVGTGGMKSKLLAAKTAMTLGVPVFIGHGNGTTKLLDVLNGEGDGTYIANQFHAPVNTRKQWIALHSESAGEIYVDQGAEEAILYNGKSLLPAGVFNVKGTFHKGDVVNVYGTSGFLGKGEINCSSDELKKTVEKRDDVRGVGKSAEVIHRDGWVKMGSE
ncbi:glutamate 5-kinase [Virgibacillus natechei]|uniref:Glutamate 5-kinase n=1 Tax=Virgibacillus natechei TaxID=1216297 RepID=A0ABS4IGM5_9BACI|nr:glutamate 5-kinase [Virgibacillus natechei]MBP1970080.1 glutamate 5-kinase [Virgibacillus natechei]UZD14161.1 glutamate 5-kinase [Virgibacillus natechei]